MEDFTSLVENSVMFTAVAQDACEDACSICLEPFSSDDPATITNCKHDYHLHCILEWSQRSKECPICCQLLVLKDPTSQELLASVEIERNSRSKHRSSNTPTLLRIPSEDFHFSHVAPYTDDSDFDERIMQHLAATSIGRARHFSRRERRRSSGVGSSQILVFASPANGPDVLQTYSTAPIETQNPDIVSSQTDPPTAILSAVSSDQQPSLLSSSVNPSSDIADHRHDPHSPGVHSSQTPPDSPQRSRSSEFLSFSESLKSRLSAASSRYKESISKSTRGFKEKLLARNNSVKELSKEVQREVSAGIAGVARMMERLDPTSKRGGGSVPVSRVAEGTSNFTYNEKTVQENLIAQSQNINDGETVDGTNSNAPVHVSGTLSSVSGRLEVSHAQDAL